MTEPSTGKAKTALVKPVLDDRVEHLYQSWHRRVAAVFASLQDADVSSSVRPIVGSITLRREMAKVFALPRAAKVPPDPPWVGPTVTIPEPETAAPAGDRVPATGGPDGR